MKFKPNWPSRGATDLADQWWRGGEKAKTLVPNRASSQRSKEARDDESITPKVPADWMKLLLGLASRSCSNQVRTARVLRRFCLIDRLRIA